MTTRAVSVLGTVVLVAALGACKPTHHHLSVQGSGNTTTIPDATTSTTSGLLGSTTISPADLPAVFSDGLAESTKTNLPTEPSFSGAQASAVYAGGAYQISDKSPNFEIYEMVPDLKTVDTAVSADVTPKPGASDYAWGLLCRATGSGANAAFYVLAESPSHYTILYDAPNAERILTKVSAPRPPNGSLHLQAFCTGSDPTNLALLVNGVEVIHYSDSSSTRLGFGGQDGVFSADYVGSSVVDFRNLEIRGDV